MSVDWLNLVFGVIFVQRIHCIIDGIEVNWKGHSDGRAYHCFLD